MTMRGRFVVLDGPDGGGKSTQARRLVERLEAGGRAVLHVRDPGSTHAGERIRSLLLDPDLGEVVPICEVLLYQAARAQLVRERIAPALAEGRDVVCERWHFATMAYQAFGGGAPAELVRVTSALATGGIEPDRAVLLDLGPEEAGQRMEGPRDRIEARDDAYRERVADGFRRVFAEDPQHRFVVDATGSPDEVELRLWMVLAPVLTGSGAR
jgi:dTMP kinase